MTAPVPSLSVHPLRGVGDIHAGDDLGAVLAAAATSADGTTAMQDGDCVVVTQKIVSKAEGRSVALDRSEPGRHRRALIEAESERVLRRRGDLLISETRHGFVCANAGVDASNVPEGTVTLLPVDADRSAGRIRSTLARRAGVDVAVIVTDTFGRPWREGVCDVAIGVAGIAAVVDLRGTNDAGGRPLEVTEVAVADEIAAAADLVMGKSRGVPAAVVRGLDPAWFVDSSVRRLVRRPSEDLFR